MFEVGWSEIWVIVIVLIVVVGPKDLPKMLRAFGKATTKFRATAGEFRRQFDEALKEAELDDVRNVINDAKSLDPRNDIRKVFDPVRTMGEEIRSTLKDATSTAKENVAIPDPEAPGATQLQPQVMEPLAAAPLDAPAKPTVKAAEPEAVVVKKNPTTKKTGKSAAVADAKLEKTPAKRTAKPRAKAGDTGTPT